MTLGDLLKTLNELVENDPTAIDKEIEIGGGAVWELDEAVGLTPVLTLDNVRLDNEKCTLELSVDWIY